MTTTLTSRLAYNSTTEERRIQTELLFRLYETRGAVSDREAAYVLGWYPSQISARRNDLLKQGRVADMGKKKDQDTGKLVMVWGVVKDTLDI